MLRQVELIFDKIIALIILLKLNYYNNILYLYIITAFFNI
jgi:hypothetical protein